MTTHLHTERTRLRPLGPQDLAVMHPMWTGRHVRRFLWDDVVITEDIAAGALTASVAATDVPNVASVRVMERLGMRFERRGVLQGLNTLFYRITRDEFGRALSGSVFSRDDGGHRQSPAPSDCDRSCPPDREAPHRLIRDD